MSSSFTKSIRFRAKMSFCPVNHIEREMNNTSVAGFGIRLLLQDAEKYKGR